MPKSARVPLRRSSARAAGWFALPSKEQKHLELEAVGLNYRVTPASMKKIIRDLPTRVRLERELKNQFDENAVKVLLVQEDADSGWHIGYLPRAVAKVIAPKMDKGGWWMKPFRSVWLTDIDERTGTGRLTFSREPDEDD
jgi:HIRAN domain